MITYVFYGTRKPYTLQHCLEIRIGLYTCIYSWPFTIGLHCNKYHHYLLTTKLNTLISVHELLTTFYLQNSLSAVNLSLICISTLRCPQSTRVHVPMYSSYLQKSFISIVPQHFNNMQISKCHCHIYKQDFT